MPTGDTNKPFQLGTWLVQPDLNRLTDGDRVVTLEPRLMNVLTCLASRPGKIVSPDELLNTIWDGRAHVDNTVYQALAHLRKALGDDVHQPRFIETIAKKGYRLIAPITVIAADTEVEDIALQSSNGGRHRRRSLTILAGVASIAVAIVLTAKPDLWSQLSSMGEGPGDRSVAVLPFVDMSEEGDQEYLGDGVAEELIHVLSNLPDLRVTARTSSFAFRDSNEDIRQIGSKLGVATILEGSVRKDGDRIRVTSQLVDTRDGFHLWSQTFDRRTTDLFSIQREIAVAVARTFEYRELGALATDGHAAQLDELQSYDFYLLGLHHLRKNTASSDKLAIQHFERAIAMDPTFARAYAGLSKSYTNWYWREENQDLGDKAEAAAEYALLLDDQSGEAYAALGLTKFIGRDYAGAEKALVRAIELNQNDAETYISLMFAYNRQGKKDKGFALAQQALVLDPMSGLLNTAMGLYQYEITGGDWDEVFKYWKRAMERDPDHLDAIARFGLYYEWTGQLDQAIPYFKKIIDPGQGNWAEASLAMIYIDIGDLKSAGQVIGQMRKLEPNNFWATNSDIQLQLARGDLSAAGDIVHRVVPANIDNDLKMSLMATYELIIGDFGHAEEVYARLAAKESDMDGQLSLHRTNELSWGVLGAVNVAYLQVRNGDTPSAQELLHGAREFIDSKSDQTIYNNTMFTSSIPYVLAQIAAIEGNNDAAIEYLQKAVDAGWGKAWFARIDPIMADLRKDARYMRILEELEVKLLRMRERTAVLASN